MCVPLHPLDTQYEPPEKVSLACKDWHEAEVFAAKASLEQRYHKAHPEDEAPDADGPKQVKDFFEDDPNIPKDSHVWELATHYIACLCVNIILLVSPERIALGESFYESKQTNQPTSHY